MKKKISSDKLQATSAEAQAGDGGATGDGSAGGAAGGSWIPNYYELIGVSADEKELAGLAEQALFQQRVSIKAQGIEVTALSKIQKIRNQLQEPGQTNNNDGGGGLALDEHPELAEQGGDIDPNLIVLPESEAAERASNDPQLRNRLAAKLGMSGGGLSMQSLKEEYANKMKMRAQPPGPAPRYRPTNAPRLTR